MSDFKKLEVDFKKLKDQFGVIGEWINKRTKDPAKCPCCKQPIQDNLQGMGVAMVPQKPGTQSAPPAPTSRLAPELAPGPVAGYQGDTQNIKRDLRQLDEIKQV